VADDGFDEVVTRNPYRPVLVAGKEHIGSSCRKDDAGVVMWIKSKQGNLREGFEEGQEFCEAGYPRRCFGRITAIPSPYAVLMTLQRFTSSHSV
jgi:hypothetical protein